MVSHHQLYLLAHPGMELTHDKVMHLCVEVLLRSHHPNLVGTAVQGRYIQPLFLGEKGLIWGSSCPFSCGLKLDVVFPHPWWTLIGDRVGLKPLADISVICSRVAVGHQGWGGRAEMGSPTSSSALLQSTWLYGLIPL